MKATKGAEITPTDPREQYWRDLRLLESRRDRLRADLARVEAELERRTAEFVAMLPAARRVAESAAPPVPAAPAGATFTARVLALFDDHPELKARDVVLNLGLPVTEDNMDRAKRTLKKLHDSNRIKRSEPGLYEGV